MKFYLLTIVTSLLLCQPLIAQTGLELGIPELVRSSGALNPAIASANRDQSGQIAGYFGKIPYNTPVAYYEDLATSGQGGISGVLRLSSFSMSGAFYGNSRELSDRNFSEYTYGRSESHIFLGLGFQPSKQWSLGAAFRAHEFDADLDSADNILSERPQHNYFAYNFYLRLEQSSLEWNFMVSPYQDRSWTQFIDAMQLRLDSAWRGPVGLEFAVAKRMSFGSLPAKIGFRSLLELPSSEMDKTHFEATPYLKLGIAKQSTIQTSFSMGTANGDAFLAANLGLDVSLVKGLFLSFAMNMENSHYLLDAESETMAGFNLGVGWNFR